MTITLILAFVFRPMQKGLDYYVLSGWIVLIVIFFLPYFNGQFSVVKKILMSFGMPCLLFVVWCVGFLMADYKIITKLF
jgi:uncharacterized membrane protein YccF (DUF307 family)